MIIHITFLFIILTMINKSCWNLLSDRDFFCPIVLFFFNLLCTVAYNLLILYNFRSSVLVLSILIDRWFYGDWILVQMNFLEFNILKGGGSFYGTHPWHWYLTQGYPVIMTVHLFPFILGAWKAQNKVLLFLIVWTVFFYR